VFWDDLIRRWRRERRVVDPRDLRAAGGHVAVLPAPRRRRRSHLPWLVITVLAFIGAFALALFSGGLAEAAYAVVS
jgi:hypothetical protein